MLMSFFVGFLLISPYIYDQTEGFLCCVFITIQITLLIMHPFYPSLKEGNYFIFYLQTFITLKKIINANVMPYQFVTYCTCLENIY